MSFAQEWESFKTPTAKEVKQVPEVGQPAPTHPSLNLLDSDKPTLIVFLRHCGCPFAEKTFRSLTRLSAHHSHQVRFVAISHSSPEATERWVVSVGGTWSTEVMIDEQRDLYAQYGLGVSSGWHLFSPQALYRTFRLAKDEKIWNRPTEGGGNRWQVGGAAFGVDDKGMLRWRHFPRSVDDLPDLEDAMRKLGVEPVKKPEPEPRTDGFL